MIPVPEHVLAALASNYGVNPEELSFLGGGREDSDGTAYWFEQEGVLRVIKILAIADEHPAGLLCHEERLKFLRFLGEKGADIVFPLPSLQGELYEMCHDGKHTFVGYVMDKVEGEHLPPEKWDDAFYHSWGRVIGRMHRLAREYPTWQCSVSEKGEPLLGWEQEWRGFYDWCKDEEVKEAWQEIGRQLEELPVSRDSFGFIHNDPHVQNILVKDGKLCLLDFDVANYHWFANDIAIAMQSLLFTMTGGMERPLQDPKPLKQFLPVFMRGYEEENHLDQEWLYKLDLFIAYRRALLFTVMQDWLQDNKELRQSWKKMILESPQDIREKVLKELTGG